jgi:hypothetical protein
MKALFVVLLAAAVAACGEGRAIFNIDAQSFMEGGGKDTIPYAVPPASSVTASTVSNITLPPGFGSSTVDSVRITNGGANLINATGTGTIGFQLFFAADSAGTFTGPAALSVPVTTVNGAQTVPVTITGDLSPSVAALFASDKIWMRIAITGTNAGATPVTGKGVLTALQIRVVLQDKIL